MQHRTIFESNALRINAWNEAHPEVKLILTQVDGFLPVPEGEISPIIGFVRSDGSFAHPFPDDLEKTITHIEKIVLNSSG